MHLGDNDYVEPAPYLFPWCIQERLEAAIRDASGQHANLANRYEKHRAKFVEENSIGWLVKALPGAKAYRKLTYTTADADGKHGWELDGLVLYDGHLFPVEVKAGTLNQGARQGKASHLADRVKTLIADAHDQVGRAVEYLLHYDNPEFQCDGQTIRINKDEINSILPVTVSLESLGGVASSYETIIAAGFGKSEVIPWAVPYHDLRIICDLAESPAVLIAYIRERLRLIGSDPIEGHDEVSWFGWFLQKGLQFGDGQLSRADRIMLSSSTGEIDNYYLADMGQRTIPTPKPRLQAPATFLRLFRELEAPPDPGVSWLASRFLSCKNADRQAIAEHVDRIRAMNRRDGKQHDFSVTYKDGGLTVLARSRAEFEKIEKKIQSYAQAKKYQAKRAWWIFILTTNDQSNLVAHAGGVAYPYENCSEADAAVRHLPAAILKFSQPLGSLSDDQGVDGAW